MANIQSKEQIWARVAMQQQRDKELIELVVFCEDLLVRAEKRKAKKRKPVSVMDVELLDECLFRLASLHFELKYMHKWKTLDANKKLTMIRTVEEYILRTLLSNITNPPAEIRFTVFQQLEEGLNKI